MPEIETTNAVFKRVLGLVVALVVVTVCVLGAKITWTGEPQLLAAARPNNLGVQANQLAACPSTPNCVNSQSQDAVHRIAPLTYDSTAPNAMIDLETVLKSFRRVKVIAETKNYIYTEFTIPVVGFVDDVEFLVCEDAKVIHVRSASRLGMSDLGVNRNRIESIRAKFSAIERNNSNHQRG